MHIHRSGKGADLNLVPYIDLLTALIAFLLITAVWTQLARLQVRHRETGGHENSFDRQRVSVLVGEHGFNVTVDEHSEPVPRSGGGHDFAALRTALEKVKAALPDNDDLLVSSEDGVTFDILVSTMDTALGAGFPGVSLADSGAAGL